MTDLENYLANLNPEQLAHYNRIKSIVANIVPEFEEVISYGVPTLKYKGKYIIYFGAYENHMSVYPGPRQELRDKLESQGFTLRKGTVQFSANKPVPEDVLREMITDRYTQLTS